MEGKLEVTWNGQTVGMVIIQREGLYYRILCHCTMVDDCIHRLYADSEKIGVLVPDGGELVLETRVAAKRIKDGCTFALDGQYQKFVPIRPGEPFAHLDKLRTAKLTFRDGTPGIVLPA